MATTPAQLYNSLPYLHEAESYLLDEPILKGPELLDLLTSYPEYGVCLVHRHCTLEDGERMITHPSNDPYYDTITGPTKSEKGVPHAWLVDGTPFEYSQVPVPELPDRLLKGFRKAMDFNGEKVNTWNRRTVLGICYVGPSKSPFTDTTIGLTPEWLEITIGRENYLRSVTEKDLEGNHAETIWCVKYVEREPIIECHCLCIVGPSGFHVPWCPPSTDDGL
ncbi:hypothetical protein AX16_008978 [Volvariella volvacea WC 439]|nr:hypothetical protein AX16_008978 [Volvariella volvacea WC 439]